MKLIKTTPKKAYEKLSPKMNTEQKEGFKNVLKGSKEVHIYLKNVKDKIEKLSNEEKIIRLENGITLKAINDRMKGGVYNFEGKEYYVCKDKEDLIYHLYGNKKLNIDNTRFKPNQLITTFVTDMSQLFYFNYILNVVYDLNYPSQQELKKKLYNYIISFNQDISNWDTSNVTNFFNMFYYDKSFNQPIGGWNTSKVTNMSGIFYYAESFNQPICGWDTSKVTNMENMFNYAKSFNQPIGNWNTSKVTDMTGMFFCAKSFNQDIGNWNTSKVKSMSEMFEGASSFNQLIGNWDVSNVIYMGSMFNGAEKFNQPLNNWNTSKVKSMSHMFAFAKSFNQPLNNWNTSNVKVMIGMFEGAKSFNQNISNWDIKKIEDFDDFDENTSKNWKDEFKPKFEE